jgi:hypothetical protein
MKKNTPRGVVRSVVDRFSESVMDLRMLAVDLVCRGFCEYYREGRGGEEDCAGFKVIVRGMEEGFIVDGHFRRLVGIPPDPPEHSTLLQQHLCRHCTYLKEAGCDFMGSPQVEGSTPCGGYRLLTGLLKSGSLTQNDLTMVL